MLVLNGRAPFVRKAPSRTSLPANHPPHVLVVTAAAWEPSRPVRHFFGLRLLAALPADAAISPGAALSIPPIAAVLGTASPAVSREDNTPPPMPGMGALGWHPAPGRDEVAAESSCAHEPEGVDRARGSHSTRERAHGGMANRVGALPLERVRLRQSRKSCRRNVSQHSATCCNTAQRVATYHNIAQRVAPFGLRYNSGVEMRLAEGRAAYSHCGLQRQPQPSAAMGSAASAAWQHRRTDCFGARQP
jgi:hypothetical protein